MGKPLIVYKASAGSGKTFTLATEYIKLLVENPLCYKSILAVTFTNKATEEMKSRILSQLYGIWKQLDDSDSYMQKVCQELKASPSFVSKRAGIALNLLLHNYNHFHVETIDSFFQRVLRNLAHELDLTPTLRIELDSNQVEEFAVDSLVESLDKRSEELGWIMRYVYEKIADNNSWNVIGSIKEFGQTIFKDYYRESGEQLMAKMEDKKFLEGFIKRLKTDRDKARETMEDYADRFFKILETEGLSVDDLSRKKSGPAGFFLKLKQGRLDESLENTYVMAAADSPEAWTSKTSKLREQIKSVAEAQLMPLLAEALRERPAQYDTFMSSSLTLKHLYKLRLLGSIERKIREVNEDANRFLLADTQHILHSLIGESDSPFIYEKIGTRLDHIMIDEFQDTGTLQWANFKTLLLECMSRSGASNLIVGDVKQSIYRWRAGDWRLLNGINSQFPQPRQQLEIQNLDTNYRSTRRVVEFNNAFFIEAARLEYENLGNGNDNEAAQLLQAYGDVEQKVPERRGNDGYVNVTLLPAEDSNACTLERVGDIVEELIGKGVEARRIAILIRTNKYIPLIAKYMSDRLPNIPIVSNEAFRLDASLAVNTIVMAMRLLLDSDDLLVKAALAKVYQTRILGRDVPDSELLTDSKAFDSLLPEDFVNKRRELVQMPLYDMAESLYSMFGIDRLEKQSAYVCAFFDRLGKLAEESFAGIDTFLEEWDAHIGAKTIQSDDVDGIRLLSIHKSKGLEFDNVIIPFCDWKLEQTGVLWCKPDREPFNELPLVPVEYSGKALKNTVFEKDYNHEHFQNTVDNLNLLYVAFTRASHNLYVIGADRGGSFRSETVKAALPEVAKKLDGAVLSGDEDGQEPVVFEYGQQFIGANDKGDKPTDNVFMQPADDIMLKMQVFETQTEFRQSNQSHEFIGENEETEQHKYLNMGKILHKVFSTIRTADDIDGALQQMESDGILYEEGQSRGQLVKMLGERLKNKRVADWFSNRWTLFNECTILAKDPQTGKVMERRPDRVMTDGKEMIVVDFKFGSPKEEHKAQVREYMDLLTAMGGYSSVSGFLWYVYSNKIESV